MRKKTSIVSLDTETFDFGDLDLSKLKKLGILTTYKSTTPNQVRSRIKNADIVLTNKVVLDGKNLEGAKNLKLICVCATGYNNIDIEYCKSRGIGVTNSRGYSTQSVIEHTIGFLYMISHRMKEHDQSFWNKGWARSPHFTVTKFPYQNLKGKTLGLIGYGTIGKGVAKSAKSLGLNVQIAKIPGRKYKGATSRKSLNQVLKTSDFISLHCPLTNLTQDLINTKSIQLMKPSAWVINMGRGPLVNEDDIAKSLKLNNISGYASDVLEQEPPQINHPFLNKALQNRLIITPHVAWASLESRRNLLMEVVENIRAFKDGQRRSRVD